MLEDFQSIELFPLSFGDVISNLVISVVCGLIISYVYRLTYRGPSYSVTFVNSLVIITMITAVVILVIGNNLARALGLVGALSIIRFRTVVRDTLDMAFIFYALAVGMAAGVGLNMVAIAGTFMIGLVIILLVSFDYARPRKRHHLLQIAYNNGDEGDNSLDRLLSKYCRQLKLVNLKNIGMSGDLEAFYHITLKNNRKSEQLIKQLQQMQQVKHVNLYFDEDDYNAPMM